MLVLVALAEVPAWGYVENGHHRAWKKEAEREQFYLEQAAFCDAEIAASRRKAETGLPFVPRSGFMPYGPTPIGGYAPQSWEEDMVFFAKHAKRPSESRTAGRSSEPLIASTISSVEITKEKPRRSVFSSAS